MLLLGAKQLSSVQNILKSGQQVAVVGRIQTRSYDNQEGKKVYVTEVIAEEVYFADIKKIGQPDESILGSSTPITNNAFEITSDDDLPF